MASDIQICNIALSKLGAATIASLSEGSQEANFCSTFYESARDAALRSHPWNFASKTRVLASTDVPTGYEETYAYSYPSDCLMASKVHDGEGNESTFRVILHEDSNGDKSKLILTNLETANLTYTVRVTDPNIYDSQFIESFALRLAAELAWPITKDHNVEQNMYTKFNNSLPETEASNSSEGNVGQEGNTLWTDYRTNGGELKY